MLKRITVDQLRLGMHVHEFCGSWMDHPFWRGAFLLDNPNDLQTIKSTGIREVWIDTSKGLDIEGGAAEEAIAAEVETTLAQAAETGETAPRIEVRQEAARAINICAKSKQAVTSMFQEARMGKALDAGDTLPIVEEISSSVMRNPGALLGLARLKIKDDYTCMHPVAVCALMVSLRIVPTKKAGNLPKPYAKWWSGARAILNRLFFEAFVKSVGIYPIGSLARLESEHLGAIIEQTGKSLLTPKVKVFFSSKSNGRVVPEIVDLSKSACKDKIVSHEDPVKWDIRDIHELWSGLPAAPW